MPTRSAVSQFVDQWSLLTDPLQFAERFAVSVEECCRILAADQHLRWRQNTPRPLPYYLQHWPRGPRAEELLIDLLVDEFGYREEAGQRVCLQQYLQELTDLDRDIRDELFQVLSEDGEAEKPEHRLVYHFAASPWVYVPDRRTDVFWIGRQRPVATNAQLGCDVVLRCADATSASRKISRRHLEVRRNGNTTFVVDRSKVGTELNGRKLAHGEPASIQEWDELDIAGMVRIRVLRRDQAVLGDMVAGDVSVPALGQQGTFTVEAAAGTVNSRARL